MLYKKYKNSVIKIPFLAPNNNAATTITFGKSITLLKIIFLPLLFFPYCLFLLYFILLLLFVSALMLILMLILLLQFSNFHEFRLLLWGVHQRGCLACYLGYAYLVGEGVANIGISLLFWCFHPVQVLLILSFIFLHLLLLLDAFAIFYIVILGILACSIILMDLF